ncbi:MAG: hypothetical protein ACRDJC_24305, partial [Thermomicrobiales bacterium]
LDIVARRGHDQGASQMTRPFVIRDGLVAAEALVTSSVAAAIVVLVADLVGWNAAAAAIAGITAPAAAGGVFAAALACLQARASAIVAPPAPTPAVAVILAAPSPIALAFVRAALAVAPAAIVLPTASLDLDVIVLLREPEIRFGQRHQCRAGAGHFLQGRAPVLKRAEHPCPVIETTFVHAAPLPSLLPTTRRSGCRNGSHPSCARTTPCLWQRINGRNRFAACLPGRVTLEIPCRQAVFAL